MVTSDAPPLLVPSYSLAVRATQTPARVPFPPLPPVRRPPVASRNLPDIPPSRRALPAVGIQFGWRENPDGGRVSVTLIA